MSATALKPQPPTKAPTIVIGLGATGLSCARFLAAQGRDFVMMDTRSEPPGLEILKRDIPDTRVILGALEHSLMMQAEQVLLSPGVDPKEPAVQAAIRAGAEVFGDVELFARHAQAPVIVITGSNGKSTVTTLLGEMAREAGRRVRVGGNLGPPALELLHGDGADLYVLELSSFQLEMTRSLDAAAAVVLNVSADHLDRHHSMEGYARIKSRAYRGSGAMVVNADDPVVQAMAKPERRISHFSLGEPRSSSDFGMGLQNGEFVFMHGQEVLMPVSKLRLAGRHNWSNVLAALALGSAIGLPLESMVQTLQHFPGLPHRCQWVSEEQGIAWYNDSKGTNVGATLAALEGMPGEKVVLIAGGEGKGADFSALKAAVMRRARAVVLVGRDAPLIEKAIAGAAPVVHGNDMAEAVDAARQLAQPGDSVLLSPACASFDMFSDYRERGNTFIAAVKGATA